MMMCAAGRRRRGSRSSVRNVKSREDLVMDVEEEEQSFRDGFLALSSSPAPNRRSDTISTLVDPERGASASCSPARSPTDPLARSPSQKRAPLT